MPIVEIHGMKVHIPEGSHSAKYAAHYLEKNRDNADAFFDEAKRNSITDGKTGVMHFKTNRAPGYKGATDFTLVHTGHNQFELRKKHFHLL